MARRPSRRHKSQGARDAGPGFVRLDETDLSSLRARSLSKARADVAAGPQRLEELKAGLRRVYPLHVIAVLAGWGLRAGLGPNGVAPRSMIAGLEQHHVELLQAVALTLEPAEWGVQPAEPEDIQALLEATIAVADAAVGARLLASEDVVDPGAGMVLALQERVRLHTQMVRNWGYPAEVRRISDALYRPLDSKLRAKLGFGPSDVLAVIAALVTTIEDKASARFRLLKSIFRARTRRQIVRLFFERYPGVEGDPEAFLRLIPPGVTLDGVRFRLLAYADRSLVRLSLVSPDEVARVAGVDEATARLILARLSHSAGALVDQPSESLVLGNPVWLRPGVADGDAYFFAFPQTALSFVHPIMRGLIAEAGLQEAYLRRRKAFLEAEAARLVAAGLPGAKVRAGAKWRWDDQPFETDALAVIDRTVVIAEAKSAGLTAEGLRGAPDRVKRHVQDLVVAPAIQSARLEDIIDLARRNDPAALAVTESLGLDPTQIDTVIRLSVTLDDFSVLTAAEGHLKRVGWVPADLALPATLGLADLSCVVDLLSPAHLLHYLAARDRLQKRVNLVADELDLLGFYLETGFILNGLPEVPNLTLSGMSAQIDRYYISRDAGVRLRKPAPRPGLLVGPLIGALEDRRPGGWTTAAIALLASASHDEQKTIRRSLEELRSSVKRNVRDPGHQRAFLWTPPDPGDPPILFHVFPRVLASDRRQVFEAAGEAMEIAGRDRCVLVGRELERWDRPFAYIGMAYAD